MKLTSSHPYWLMRHGIGDVPLPLRRNLACDVVVIGAGITGALVADALVRAGLKVVVLDKRYPAQGSTSGSTGLLQYEIDTSLANLTQRLGQSRAFAAYKACASGIRSIRTLVRTLDEDVGFRIRPSLYLASKRKDVALLREEFTLRRKAGLPCEFWDHHRLAQMVDFAAPCALWTSLAAEVDPWALTHALFRRNQGKGLEVYGQTEVMGIDVVRTGVRLLARTAGIRCRHVVVACGYESDHFLPEMVSRLVSSYALVTEPVRKLEGWPAHSLFWETARPYHYLRTTTDNRVLIGGEDSPFRSPARRDARIPGVAARLLSRARKMFPRMDLRIAYAWAGTFAETEDGLPYIGAHPDRDPRVLFALGFGGNGIIYSVLAAGILAASITGKDHRFLDLFSFDRPQS